MQDESTFSTPTPQHKTYGQRRHLLDEKECAICGSTMHRPLDMGPWQFNRRSTCSSKCQAEKRIQNRRKTPTETRACTICGKTYVRKTRNMKQWEASTVCGHECRMAKVQAARKIDRSTVQPRTCTVCEKALFCGEDEDPCTFLSRKTCGPECAATLRGASRRTATKLRFVSSKSCAHCGAIMVPRDDEYPSQFNKRRTCGSDCGRLLGGKIKRVSANEWKQGVSRICVMCGGSYQPRHHETKEAFAQRVTCGYKCSGPLSGYRRFLAKNPGKEYERQTEYPTEWNKDLRSRILRRDRHACQLCKNAERSLHIHHIDYDKKNCDPANLVTLCINCHGRTSGANQRKREEWTTIFRSIMRIAGYHDVDKAA